MSAGATWETSAQPDVYGNLLQGQVNAEARRDCYLCSECRFAVWLWHDKMLMVETDYDMLIMDL